MRLNKSLPLEQITNIYNSILSLDKYWQELELDLPFGSSHPSLPLTITANSSGFRHAVQLLTPSNILAKVKSGDNAVVTKAIVDEASQLFLDAKESAKILLAHKEGFIKQ